MTADQPNYSHPKYRPDIDGLRAVAVLGVVAFHAFPETLKGGFIGVDVFFVISGYLISKIIFENLDGGSFSFLEFYVRRIRRIFPALMVVLISCFFLSWFVLFATEFRQLGKHMAAGAWFVSNLVYWNEAGYFDNSAETKPLLHLWSLGIEEQFYIIWPLLLWQAWRRKLNLAKVVAVIALISFLLNLYSIDQNSVATFYSPVTRFWELLIGSLMAKLSTNRPRTLPVGCSKPVETTFAPLFLKRDGDEHDAWRNALSLVGVALLAFGFCQIDKGTQFPGLWALVPVGGAALIIAAGAGTWINRTILSSKIAVWLGLVSYPLYLWHWPMLSFARIVESETPSHGIRVWAVVLSLAFAWLTLVLVERPLRVGRYRTLPTVTLVIVMLSIGCIGILSFMGDGATLRTSITGIDYSGSDIERIAENDPSEHSKCMKLYELTGNIRYCSVSIAGKPNIAIIGDSHGAALYKGLAERLASEGRGISNLGGRLFLDVATFPPGSNSEIDIYKGGIRATEFVAKEESIDTVILASRGPFYLYDGWSFNLLSDPSVRDKNQVFEIGMRKTLSSLKHKKKVIFIIDNPEIDFDPRRCVMRPIRISSRPPTDCSVTRQEYDSRNSEYRSIVARVLKDYPEVDLFDSPAFLCDTIKCHAKIDGKVLYSDLDHYSVDGSRYMAKHLVAVINGTKSKLLQP